MAHNFVPIISGIENIQLFLEMAYKELEELKEQVEERDKDIYSKTIRRCRLALEGSLSFLRNVRYSLDDDDDDPETRDLLKMSPENLLDIETELIDDPNFKGAKRVVIKGQKDSVSSQNGFLHK